MVDNMLKNKKQGFILKLYQQKNSVFSLKEISMLFPQISISNLKARIHYHIQKGNLRNVRRGIYTKPDYDKLELAAKIYFPSYISLETVLEKEGVIFQHYETLFVISYLSRELKVDNHSIQFRRIKEKILLLKDGIIQKDTLAIAGKERAFLDTLYLYKNYHFDNLAALNKEKVFALAKLYQSKTLERQVRDLLKNA